MLRVNEEKCIGCGLCVNLCSAVFESEDSGKSKVKDNADLEQNKDCIKEAKESCPVGAIEEK